MKAKINALPLERYLLKKEKEELVEIILRLVKLDPRLSLFVDDRTDGLDLRIKKLKYDGTDHPHEFVQEFRRIHSLVVKADNKLQLLLLLFDKIVKILNANDQWDELDSAAMLVAKSLNKTLKKIDTPSRELFLAQINEKVGYQDFLLDFFD